MRPSTSLKSAAMQLLMNAVVTILTLSADVHAETATPTVDGETVINSAIVPFVTAPLLVTSPVNELKPQDPTNDPKARGTGPFTIHVHNNGGVSGLHINWSRNPGSPANLNGVTNGPLGSSTMGTPLKYRNIALYL